MSPDQGIVSLTVTALADTALEAIGTANVAAAAVVAAIRETGIAADDLATTSISLNPEYTYTDNGRVLTGFRYNNSLRVTVLEIGDVGAVIDAAVGAGGDNVEIDEIGFQVSQRAVFEDEARLAAVDNAIEKARAMAERAGVVLGRATLITETSFSTPRAVEAFAAAPTADFAPTPVFAGSQDITMTVSMEFEILPPAP